jgi:hypothetical protein
VECRVGRVFIRVLPELSPPVRQVLRNLLYLIRVGIGNRAANVDTTPVEDVASRI